eukprot:CAMPEP_0204835752 /NCGR_PEP_ID=MMETSP1346-20131115/23534_1 /ASSEMBLY_ACC=CAM_ASM_000771 /TAXON_ID=215587 /ORGANISM="Aplanochytrium stocchinoi, Strain GSBS06" /LENGTH=290 /DNA_ID=CAMNT_0051970027 /DNA_START=367 /DNA_END=1239 /DNA_ORIENTATION=-
MELDYKFTDFITVMGLHESKPELAHWLPGEYLLAQDLGKMFATPDLYFPDLELIVGFKESGNEGFQELRAHSSILKVRSGWFAALLLTKGENGCSKTSQRLTLDLTHVTLDGSFGETDLICSSAWRQIIRFLYTGTFQTPRCSEETLGLIFASGFIQVDKFEEALMCCFENSVEQLRALGKTDYLHTFLTREITSTFPRFWHIEALYCGALIDIAVDSKVKQSDRVAEGKNYLLSKVVGDLTNHLELEDDDISNQILAPLVSELKTECTASRVCRERAVCIVSALSILCR